jgi:hypothetical protein
MNTITFTFTEEQHLALIRALVTARSATNAETIDGLLNHVDEYTYGHPLTEAFHIIYDVKDAVHDSSELLYEAYEALQKLTTLLRSLGLDVPVRYDLEGRYDRQDHSQVEEPGR